MIIGEYRGKRLFSGRLFAGRLFGPVPGASAGGSLPFGGGYVRVRVPPDLQDELRRRLIDEDELLIILAGQILGAGLLH